MTWWRSWHDRRTAEGWRRLRALILHKRTRHPNCTCTITPREEGTTMEDNSKPIGGMSEKQVREFARRATGAQEAINAAGLGRPQTVEYKGSQLPLATVTQVLDAVLDWQRAPFGKDAVQVDRLVSAAEALDAAL